MGGLEGIIIRFLVNLTDGFVLVLLSKVLFGTKIKTYPALWLCFFTATINGMLYYYFHIINGNVVQYDIQGVLTIIMAMAAIKIFLKLTIIKNILLTLLFVGMNIITTIIYILIMKNLGLDFILDKEHFLIGAVVSFVFFLVIIWLIHIVKNKVFVPEKISRRQMVYVFVQGLVTMLILLLNMKVVTMLKVNIDILSTILIIVLFLLFFGFNIFYFFKFIKSETSKWEFEQQKHYNEALRTLLNELRGFKHNFDNTIASIYGFISMKQWEQLSIFIDELVKDKQKVDFANELAYEKIKNAGLIGLIQTKFNYMKNMGIHASLKIEGELEEVNMKITDLCRILGILLDNAIEAANESHEKSVKLTIARNKEGISFITENSCSTFPEIAKMFEKGWSTKGEGRGLGLWVVKNTLKKYNNTLFNVMIDEGLVKTELIIS